MVRFPFVHHLHLCKRNYQVSFHIPALLSSWNPTSTLFTFSINCQFAMVLFDQGAKETAQKMTWVKGPCRASECAYHMLIYSSSRIAAFLPSSYPLSAFGALPPNYLWMTWRNTAAELIAQHTTQQKQKFCSFSLSFPKSSSFRFSGFPCCLFKRRGLSELAGNTPWFFSRNIFFFFLFYWPPSTSPLSFFPFI